MQSTTTERTDQVQSPSTDQFFDEMRAARAQAYVMRRYTLVAPHVDNAGRASGYPAAVREALLAAGIDGWTEYETHGSWRGVREAGVTFEIYAEVAPRGASNTFPGRLADIGRGCMPDQEAVQVTMDESTTTLWEA